MEQTEVLVVGAGPTGLVLALCLSRLGIRVRVVDRTTGPGTTSRALGVQPRTLELYRALGLADAVVQSGHVVPAFNFWTEGVRRARIPFPAALGRLTPYPFLLIYPQDRHERLLIDRLAAVGIEVERRTELVGFTQDGSGVTAVLRAADGEEERVAAAFIAGCDGARSAVREKSGIGFPGGTYDRFFYVADIDAAGPAMNGEIHINLDTAADFLAVFPLAEEGRARLVGTVLDDRVGRREGLTFDDVSAGAVARLRIGARAVNWFSTYRVHHRVAERFRDGRAFLLGDAGHVHSPAGGQGMNTGIGDAINLAWKLAAVLRGQAGDVLLDSYEAERIKFARRLVSTTDRVFTAATSENRLAQLWRTRVAPRVVPLVNRIPAVRRFGFRAVSQIALNYRRSALSQGRVGRVRGGDRLPWVRCGEEDNFASTCGPAWQVHVYGETKPDLEGWCARHGLPLRSYRWSAAAGRAGLSRNALYLVRPDAYIAFVDRTASVSALTAYRSAVGLERFTPA